MKEFSYRVVLFILFLLFYGNLISQSLIDSTFNTKLIPTNKINVDGYLMPLYMLDNESNSFQLNYFRLKCKGLIIK